MATAQVPPDTLWRTALKLRNAVVKELELILRADYSSMDLTHFEKVETIIKNYRLVCIQVIFFNIQYASKEKIHEALWVTHVSITNCYRKVIAKMQRPDQIVLKRKLEKLYARYISTTQDFYKGFLQRFCARYHLQELKRIARKAQLEMVVPDEDQVDARSINISDVVNDIGHSTLIYLGDLSRYRTLMRNPERRSWEQALTYYSLANDLLPESGFGHHQCSVIFTENHDHLSVMYHLYRSLASQKPHPNARMNLERECKDFLKAQSRRLSATKDALRFWFVKLHGYLFKGDETRQHAELVEEVLHRLGTILAQQADDHLDALLLKMVLINICAYHVSLEKLEQEWTNEGSRSCQLILQLNVRMIEIISRHIKCEAQKVLEVLHEDASAAAGKVFSINLKRAVPLLRIYMTWVFYYRADLKEYSTYLQPYFNNMCETLNATLGYVLALVDGEYPYAKLVACRFREDEETLGLRCLNGPDLPEGCRLYFDPVEQKPKPYPSEYTGPELNEDQVTFTRLIDIMNCALSISKDGFPLQWKRADLQKETQQVALVEDRTETGSLPSAEVTGTETVLYENAEDVGAQESINDLLENSHSRDTVLDGQVDKPEQALAEVGLDNQLYQIVNDFLVPPEAEKSPESTEETSYGMGCATAKDVFAIGESSVTRSPASASRKTFPTLPWNYFYSPTSGAPPAQPPAARIGWDTMSANMQLSPADVRHRAPTVGDGRNAWTGRSPPQQGGYPGDVTSSVTFGSLRLNPQNGFHDSGNQVFSINDTNRDAFRDSASFRQNISNGTQRMQQLSDTPPGFDHVPSMGSSQRTPVQRPNFYASEPFPSTMAFSEQASSMPPVNSPWGIPRQAPGGLAQVQPSTPARSFSSGSVSATTINTRPAASNPGLFYSNGNAFDATTAWGRGNASQNEMDCVNPANFSATASVLAAGKQAYNRQALLSAFEDSSPKHALPAPIGTKPNKF